MCKYYAHSHPCGHVKTVFAAFCSSAALVQKPCGRGDIWATVKVEKECQLCDDDDNDDDDRSSANVSRARMGGTKNSNGTSSGSGGSGSGSGGGATRKKVIRR